jgi:protoheme IX farnesyltransferase
VNCLIEAEVDARMNRTRGRATARGELAPTQVLIFSGVIGGAGMLVLHSLVNPLTMWLTFATFVGYAVVYTVLLKPNTPQNIVIGGLSGAMPPALGWAAVANNVPAEAWVLVLIIFIWTPPHFWALCLYKTEEYNKSGLPMLPVTHGQPITRLHVFLYTVALVATTTVPFAMRMSGLFYLACAMALGVGFLFHAWKVWKRYSDDVARATFRYSIVYLSLLFAALLIDHYIRF